MKKDTNSNNEKFVVNLMPSAKFFFVSLFFIDAVCIFLLIYFFLFPEDTTLLEKIIFVPLICLMLAILIVCGIIFIRTRIVVIGDEFVYYPCLGKKRVYSFSQITKITLRVQIGHCFYTVYTDKKLLSMSQITKNQQLFIYKCVQHNIPIEELPKKQRKE